MTKLCEHPGCKKDARYTYQEKTSEYHWGIPQYYCEEHNPHREEMPDDPYKAVLQRVRNHFRNHPDVGFKKFAKQIERWMDEERSK